MEYTDSSTSSSAVAVPNNIYAKLNLLLMKGWALEMFPVLICYSGMTFICWHPRVFRVLHSNEPTAFHGLFQYLEDRFIVSDKSEIWKCISVVASRAFESFLNVKAEQVSNSNYHYSCRLTVVIGICGTKSIPACSPISFLAGSQLTHLCLLMSDELSRK